MKENFIEAHTLEDANAVDLNEYVFLERMSAATRTYCFKIRERERKR